MAPNTRVGLIGYGLIGSAVRDMIDNDPDNGMEVVFINDADTSRLSDLGDLALNDLAVDLGASERPHVAPDHPGQLQRHERTQNPFEPGSPTAATRVVAGAPARFVSAVGISPSMGR